MNKINLDAYKEEVGDKFSLLENRLNKLQAHFKGMEEAMGDINNMASPLAAEKMSALAASNREVQSHANQNWKDKGEIVDKLQKVDKVEIQQTIVNEKIMRLDERVNHYGEAIDDVMKSLES